MSENKFIGNSFFKGMNRDVHPSAVPNDTYYYALNAIAKDMDQELFISNESSTTECSNIPGNIVGYGRIEERNMTIFFTDDGGLHVLDHEKCEYKLVCRDSEFGCDWNFDKCEWIEPEYKTVQPCGELYIYWSSGCEYYWINLDEMLVPERKAGLIESIKGSKQFCSERDCEYFKVFSPACAPKISTMAYDTGGGALPAGSYQFTCRLKDEEGGWTNWFNFSDPVFVGSDHNQSGEMSNGHVEINISGLSCQYNTIELASVETVGGNIAVKSLITTHYNNNQFSYDYYGTEGIPIAPEEVLIKGDTYIQGKELKSYNNQMLYYKIKNNRNLDYQTRANGISTEWVVYQMSLEDAAKVDARSFMRGETYGFGIVWNYLDGTHSRVFHIPAGGGGGGSPSSVPGKSDFGTLTSLEECETGPGVSNAVTATGISPGVSSCTYENFNPKVDVIFSATIDKLTLEIQTELDDDPTYIINCIVQCIEKGPTTIYLKGQNDATTIFTATGVQDIRSKRIVFSGINYNDIRTDIVAEKIETSCVEQTSSSSGGGGGGSAGGGGGGGASGPGNGIKPVITQIPEWKLKRGPTKDAVWNPQNEKYDDIIKEALESYETYYPDNCDEVEFDETWKQCAGCGDPNSSEQCREDSPKIDTIYKRWEDLLNSYGLDYLDETHFDNPNITKAAASIIANAVKERETVKEIKALKFEIQNKSGSYGGGGVALKRSSDSGVAESESATNTTFASGIFDTAGFADGGVEFREIASGSTEVDTEQDIRYPDTKNCAGEPIYGGLAGSNVRHHKFPTAAQQPHYVSLSVGVPGGTFYPDADEYSDGYVNLMGVRFSGITRPSDEEVSKPICSSNPYTIVMIKRTAKNKKVIMKGLGTKTFSSTNQGKSYHYPRNGLNSTDTVKRSVDLGGDFPRLAAGAGDGNSFLLWSYDGLVRKPALTAESFRTEGTFFGVGERYGLYAKGKTPANDLHGTRIDNGGARQAINLNQFTPSGGGDTDLAFKIYAPADSVVAPPPGGTIPLMNKWEQECVWLGGSLPISNDRSFVGDVLNHNAPVHNATGAYVSLVRDLPNQYGDLTNMNYIPLFQAGKNAGGTIQGWGGDTYIGPYSFIRTSYISDRVGRSSSKFQIPNMVGTKVENRDICDGPEDVAHHNAGLWVWTKIPETDDPREPKNWCGLHTPGDAFSLFWDQAKDATPTTDYYFPHTLKTLITVWGEWEANPYKRQRGDLLEDQVYPDIRSRGLFEVDSGNNFDWSKDWRDCMLNQFYFEIEQPSMWKRYQKALIRTLLTLIAPMMGIDNFFDIVSGIDIVGNLAELPLLTALWYYMTQVLFRNDLLDKYLGIPVCKTDDEGGLGDAGIKNFFSNYDLYNGEYSKQNDFYQYYGIPDPYYTCDCDDCTDLQVSNRFYISDKHTSENDYDAYKIVRPMSYKELEGNRGTLQKFFVRNGQLYAHTTDGLYVVPRGRTLVPNTIGEILLGNSSDLAEPVGLFQGPIEGYAGLSNFTHSINTQYGYFFVDQEARKVYRFDGQLDEISRKGMFNFFKEHLGYCETTGCMDEQVQGTSSIALGVDPRLNRFLITKNEPGCGSFTASYDIERQAWISFHSYQPQFYVWDRDHMYSIDGSTVWKHNSHCNYQTFYGEYYPYILEFSANEDGMNPFEFKSAIIDSRAYVCTECGKANSIDDNKTFNKIWLRNDFQTTGYINLVPKLENDIEEDLYKKIKESSGDAFVTKEHRQWRVNQLYDFTAASGNDIITCDCCCFPVEEPTNVSYTKALNEQYSENRIIQDTHLTTRLIYDQDATTKLYLRRYINYIQIPIR